MKTIDEFIKSNNLIEYQISGQTWYKLVDVGEAIGYIRARKAIMRAHQEEFDATTMLAKIPVKSINTATGKEYTAPRESLFINKEGITKLLIYSNLPSAQ
ncbi:MAG: BRO family protein [Bacillota bacterium]